MVVDLDAPLSSPLSVPGVSVESIEAAGRRITYSLDGATTTAGELLRRLADVTQIRDISVQEPGIEEVVAKLYRAAPKR